MLYHEASDTHKGRCAIASCAIRSGTRVLSTAAVCAVSSCCGWCFTPNASLSHCTGCRQARYCSRSCQQRDWPQHRRECAAWRTIPKDATSPSVLLVARLSANLFLDCDANVLQQMTQLRDHLDDHRDDKLKQFKDMTQLVLLLLSRWKTEDNKKTDKSFEQLKSELEPEILKLFGRVNCNAFSVANNVTNEVVGIGLYPEGALFNHDCDPNCVVSFQAQQMQVYAVKDVAPGEELTVSYIELFQPTLARRRELKESYFFDCECARCLAALKGDSQDDWYLNGWVCNNKECKEGVMTVERPGSAVCKICGTTTDANEMKRCERELELLKVRDAASEEIKWEKYRQQWELAKQLHPRNTRMAALAREIGNFLVNAKSLDLQLQALPFFLAELHAVEWLLPHTKLPSRGLLLFQIGKSVFEEVNSCSCSLSSADQAAQLARAAKTLQEALVVLNGAYGSGSTAVKSAQLLLDEVQRPVH